MDVETTRWWMKLPVPFADRVFAAEFAAIMRHGQEGLARRLGVSVAERDRPGPGIRPAAEAGGSCAVT